MIPRWHFVLKSSLMLVGVVTIALITVYLASFLVFVFHTTGIWAVPTFGLRGLLFFVTSSPWILILSVLIFLTLLYVLVSQYAFSYKKPLVYSILGIVLIVVGLSSSIQYAALHDRIHEFAEKRNIPGVAPLYRSVADRRPQEISFGTISEVQSDGFLLVTDRGEELTVRVSARTKQPPRQVYSESDTVMVFGFPKDGTVDALGIRPADKESMPSPEVRGARFVPREVR